MGSSLSQCLTLILWPALFLLLVLHAPPSHCGIHHHHPANHLPLLQSQFLPQKDWFSKIGHSNFTYRSLVTMLAKKKKLVDTISGHMKTIQQLPSISAEVLFKMKVLDVYQREMKAAETSLVIVLKDLNQTLSSDYHSIDNIKLSCKARQEDMRNAAIQVEEDYNVILELEREMMSHHPNSSLQTHFNLVNEFLAELSHAADTLENELVDDVFSNYKKIEGAGIETVVKLSENSLSEHSMKRLQQDHPPNDKESSQDRSRSRGGGISMLIDSSSNQYILSRPRDVTFPIEDHHFIHDIINLLLVSFVFRGLCSLLKVPSLFGYILAGMILGPTGFNLISSVVQVETLGEVGVIFIVFTVGLEFSAQKLQKVWCVAVYGSNLLLACSILLAIVLGLVFQVHPRHSLFVAACLSFSSNPLATRIVDRNTLTKRSWSNSDQQSSEDPETDVVDSVSGVLMMQDIQLGMLMALLPFFEGGASGGSLAHQHSVVLWLVHLVQVIFGFPVLVFLLRSLVTRVAGKVYRQFSHILNRSENVLLVPVALCFGLLLVAEFLNASIELGCFLAGMITSSQGSSEVDQVKKAIRPIRDLFSVFFFASLGFHVYPTFLKLEFSTMFTVMICIVTLKFILSMCVLGACIGHCGRHTMVISISLAQVSEFSFILSSRARRMGIISREVYLVILSITTLSLLISPLLWRIFLSRPFISHSSLLVSLPTRLGRKFSGKMNHVAA